MIPRFDWFFRENLKNSCGFMELSQEFDYCAKNFGKAEADGKLFYKSLF
jgi:hypothetical protein